MVRSRKVFNLKDGHYRIINISRFIWTLNVLRVQ